MRPIELEVVAPMLSSVDLTCRGWSCILGYVGLKRKYHNLCINEYPDDWKLAVDSLSQWVRRLSGLYLHRIRIRVIDAQSPLGLWKQIRYRVFRFPAFIIDKKHTYVGWNSEHLEALINDRIHHGI